MPNFGATWESDCQLLSHYNALALRGYPSGCWTAAMVTVGYAASWLRTLLDAAPSGDSVPIGYHVASKDSTMVIYSRDALADPLRQLVSLVQEVSDGKFQPDLTRSGMMLAQTTNNEAPRSQCQADAEVQPDSSSESSMDEEDGNPTDDEAAVDEVVGAWAPIDAADDDRQYVRHKTSRFLDLIKDEAGAELMCGRKLSVNYRKLPRKPKFVYPACSVSDECMSCLEVQARALEIGLTQTSVDKLDAEGLNTMAIFAFSCNFAPDSPDEKPLTDLVTKVLGATPSTKEMSCMRRLFADAYATVASDIKSKVEASDDTAVKKLAPADSDSLVDKAVAIYESDRLLYQEWSTCVSREHELATGLKKDTGLTFDASGALKLASKQHAAPCDTSSEMMVRYCLVRRGLALEQANVMSYENHDLLVEKLFQYRLQEPPPDFARVSMQQMQAADRKFFMLLAEVTRSGIKASAAGRPCDKAFQSCLTSSEFLTILQHKPLAVYSHDVREPLLKRPRVEGARGGKGAKGNGKGQTPGKGDGKGESAGRVPSECKGSTSDYLRMSRTRPVFPMCFKTTFVSSSMNVQTTGASDCSAPVGTARGCERHEPWGFNANSETFHTRDEAAYPRAMCEAICDVAEASLGARGMSMSNSRPSVARAMKQERGRLHPQVVSEYSHVVSYLLPG
ncbi:unnamed protein product, partial [Symbiodinium microadriaticum]